MSVKRGLSGIIMTVWTFISMVIIPLSTLTALERGVTIRGELIRVSIVALNKGMILMLGLLAMILTALSYSVSEKSEALLVFLKYVTVAYYEWVWAEGVKRLEIETPSGLVHVGVFLGLWIILVIIGSIITGLLKAICKYSEAIKKERKAKEKET